MAIDIEKLKSIIRLANNNPNENEANLAARKACKILAEDNFKFLNPQPATTWNDVKRSTEPGFRSPPTGKRAYDPIWEDMLRRGREQRVEAEKAARAARDAERIRQEQVRKEQAKREEENKKAYQSVHYEPINYKDFVYDFDNDIFENFYETNFKPGNPHQRRDSIRTCSKCGLRTSTYNKENPFICGICASPSAYQGKNDPKSQKT
jgi:hypothetical protein